MKKWLLFSCCLSFAASSASIGTYRIYLDSNNRQEKFIVNNRNALPEQCEVSFSYMAYKENAEVVKLNEQQQLELSEPALSRLRYSPRKFTLEPKTFQYIAFTYRRQINDTPSEHRTYANIKCLQIDNQSKVGVSLKPTIMHSVPLVIRTGKASDLEVNLSFQNIVLQDNQVSFRLAHQGERSVYGDIVLQDTQGELIELLQRNVVIYPEMQYKTFAFSLPDSTDKEVKIVFQETGPFKNNQQFELLLQGDN